MSFGVLQHLIDGLPEPVTPCTPVTGGGVTAQPAPMLACTRVTCVTPLSGDTALQSVNQHHVPGEQELNVTHERAALLELALRVTYLYDDDEAARQQMREQCLALSPHLQADLLEHFRTVYGDRLKEPDADSDDRRTCSECRYGRGPRCPNGWPLPAGVLHRCPAWQPRVAS